MKTCVFLFCLIIHGKYGLSKNLDEISSSTSEVPIPTTGTLINKESIIPDLLITTSSPVSIRSTTESLNIPDVIVKNVSDTNVSLVDNLSTQFRLILKHFQDPDPIGLPGKNILPEPMEAENVTTSTVAATGSFFNIKVYGLNNFSISAINTFLDQMEVSVVLKLKTVVASGNYTIDNFFLSNEGPFNISFNNVTTSGTIGLAINEDGQLYTNKSILDITYDHMDVDLTNVSGFVRPFLSTSGAQIFAAEKPLILDNINQRLIVEINRRLENFPKIPKLYSLSPVDLAVLEGRRFVKKRYEPFIINKVLDFDSNFFKVTAGPVSVTGISKFARVGNITLSMENRTIDLRIRIITGKLLGNCKWYYDIGKVGITRNGQSNFSISHLQFEAKIQQSVDSRKPPVLEDLEVETGPILIKMDGHGSLDYIVELVSKLLPNLLRHIIIDVLEEPIKHKIQTDILDKINVEQVYEENLPDIKRYISDRITYPNTIKV